MGVKQAVKEALTEFVNQQQGCGEQAALRQPRRIEINEVTNGWIVQLPSSSPTGLSSYMGNTHVFTDVDAALDCVREAMKDADQHAQPADDQASP